MTNRKCCCVGVSRMQILHLRFLACNMRDGVAHTIRKTTVACVAASRSRLLRCVCLPNRSVDLCVYWHGHLSETVGQTASRNTGIRSISEGWLVAAFHPSCDPPIPLGDYPPAGSTLLMVSFNAIPKWRSLEISNYGLLRNFLENRYCSVIAALFHAPHYPSCLGGFHREIRLIFNATKVVLHGWDFKWGYDRDTLLVKDEFR